MRAGHTAARDASIAHNRPRSVSGTASHR